MEENLISIPRISEENKKKNSKSAKNNIDFRYEDGFFCDWRVDTKKRICISSFSGKVLVAFSGHKPTLHLCIKYSQGLNPPGYKTVSYTYMTYPQKSREDVYAVLFFCLHESSFSLKQQFLLLLLLFPLVRAKNALLNNGEGRIRFLHYMIPGKHSPASLNCVPKSGKFMWGIGKSRCVQFLS